jgi:hypothetical protein
MGISSEPTHPADASYRRKWSILVHLRRGQDTIRIAVWPACAAARCILFDALWLAMASIWSKLGMRPSEN